MECFKPSMNPQTNLRQDLKDNGIFTQFSSRQLMLNFITSCFPDKMKVYNLKMNDIGEKLEIL